MRDRLAEAQKKADADYCEIRFETDDSTGFGFRGKEFDHVSTSKAAGGIARACTKGGWGVATFESEDALERSVVEACRSAKLVGREAPRIHSIDPHLPRGWLYEPVDHLEGRGLPAARIPEKHQQLATPDSQ